jgi:RNase P subunit RPR2
MQRRKRAERYIKRLETEFTAAGQTHKGFLSNLSRAGLFIRTNRSFDIGSELDIKIYLPDGKESYVQGIVRRAITSEEGLLAKNGMGVELTKIDINYENLVKQVQRENVLMILCPSCGAKNKVPRDKASLRPKCGSCKKPLKPEAEPGAKPGAKPGKKKPEVKDKLTIECAICGTKNRVPEDKLSLGPKCGNCKAPLEFGSDYHDAKKETEARAAVIIKCPGCGTKNKVPGDKLSLGPKCGSCKEPLPTE